MNRNNLAQVINQYVSRFDELNARDSYDEGYKWRAETVFKRHWDIDAENFADMFKDAMSETSNLIDNKTVQPIGGILNLLKHEDEVEYVRSCFRELFSDDGGDLAARQDRIESFVEKINARIDHYNPGTWKYPQAVNHVIYYLNLWKPEENYIFKSTEATAWADCIGFGDDFGSGSSFSLEKYYQMCDELLSELPNFSLLMALHQKRFDLEAHGFNDQLHILVYDIIYCAFHYGFYTGMYIPKLSTKDRVKAAQSQKARTELEQQVIKEREVLQNLTDTIVPFPELVNSSVIHKKYGKGTVKSCGSGTIEVDFSGENKKFIFPSALEQGFLQCEDSAILDQMHAAANHLTAIQAQETKVKEFEKKLRALT